MGVEVRHGKTWQVHDGTASEIEMGDFLYGLVRMLKPELIVETGTYKAFTSQRLGEAARDNGLGQVVTCDIEYGPGHLGKLDGLPVKYVKCSSLDLPELREADFVFSDSHKDVRPLEYGLVKPGCILVMHDTDQNYGGAPCPLGKFVRAQGGLTFQAGRGFGILVKPE